MLQLNLLVAFLMLLAAFLAALVTTGSKPRRVLGMALGACTQIPAWLGAPPLARGLLGLASLMLLVRAIDLYRDPKDRTVRQRLWHAFSVVDTRLLKPGARVFDARSAGAVLLWAALGAAGTWLSWAIAPQLGTGPLYWATRWSGGLVAAYCLVETIWTAARVIYPALGFATPVLHRHPILSRTIQELWSERWGRTVTQWLQVTIFKPLVRRGFPKAGLLAGFLASAVGHAYVTWVAVGPGLGALMLAFFLVQGVLVLVERWLGVAGWGPVASRVWMLVAMVGPSPLFTEPMLRCFGIP